MEKTFADRWRRICLKKWNFIIAIVAAALGVFVLILSKVFPKVVANAPGPGVWPTILAYALIGLAALLAIVSFVSKSEHVTEKVPLSTPAIKSVYKLMALSVGFAVVFYFLGLLLSILLFIPAVMYMMGARSIKYMVLTSVLVTASIYVVFVVVLNSQFPGPIFLR